EGRVGELQRLHSKSPPGTVLDVSSPSAVGDLVSRDRVEPRGGAPALRPVARASLESGREYLGGQIKREIGPARAAPCVGEHRVYVPPVELDERLGNPRRPNGLRRFVQRLE